MIFLYLWALAAGAMLLFFIGARKVEETQRGPGDDGLL